MIKPFLRVGICITPALGTLIYELDYNDLTWRVWHYISVPGTAKTGPSDCILRSN